MVIERNNLYEYECGAVNVISSYRYGEDLYEIGELADDDAMALGINGKYTHIDWNGRPALYSITWRKNSAMVTFRSGYKMSITFK